MIPANRGSSSSLPKGSEQRLLGFFAQKFRKATNAADVDSRNHGNPAATSHQLDPYADSSGKAMAGAPLGNYNSVNQPVKATHGSSFLRSLSGGLKNQASGGGRKSSKANQQVTAEQAEVARLTTENSGLRLKVDELQEEKMQLKGNLKIQKDTI